jgi:hypothetical protein
MSKLYLGSIDVTKIDKSFIKDWVSKDGSISMGDKDNKIYIGNIKEYKKEDNNTPNVPQPKSSEPDDLPF